MARYTEKQKELLQEYRVLRDRANERLRALEKLSSDPEYENVLGYAYRLAARDIKELGIGDADKVRYRTPTNTNKLESAIKRVQNFLDMPTSTKTGIKSTYKTSATNFNKGFGTNFTWQELKSFTDSVDWDKLKAEKSYNVLKKVIRGITQNKITSQDIAEAAAKHKILVGVDKVTSDWTKRLAEQGLDADMLLAGTAKPEEIEIPFD